jgi:hypothetical protein
MARVLKGLQAEMLEQKALKNSVPSFLIESLVYNVPNNYFGADAYRSDFREILAFLFNDTLPTADCSTWTEVNGIKYLFHQTQPWSQAQAHKFIDSAWNYVGFD